MSDFLLFAAIILGLILGVVALMLAIVVPLASVSCHATANQMGLQGQYSFWTDCMINVDGRWTPLESYKVMRPTK